VAAPTENLGIVDPLIHMHLFLSLDFGSINNKLNHNMVQTFLIVLPMVTLNEKTLGS
jgi:heme/copper-type cytochrome/quinol oxidase subunit 4